VSRQSDAKKARRNKRRATRDARWLPDSVMEDLVATQSAIATDLEALDQRMTERGWAFDEDDSDEDFVFWIFEPSAADLDDDELAPVTTIWMSAEEDAQVVHLMLVGATADVSFEPEELFSHSDVIEAYRIGDPLPRF
jgi:hypothetical protein